MYVFELILNFFQKKKYNGKTYNPLDETPNELSDEDVCEHLFLPLDSSNTLFACKYCGIIVPAEKLKDRNIFRQ